MKNAVLISPPFFHYEDYIRKELEQRGYNVFYINHRKCKLLNIIYSFLPFNVQYAIFSKIIMNRIQMLPIGKIDLLIVIKGEFISKEHIQYLKKRNSQIYCIMYQWDSMNNINYFDLIPCFNKVSTFDFHDAKQYKLDYLPLFYTNDIEKAAKVSEDIDLLLIGTFNPLRYKYYLWLKNIARKNNLKLYSYIFISPYFYLKNEVIKKRLHIKSIFDVRFISMNRSKLIQYYSRAKVIVDVCVKNQTGLSMRMIESYGMNKKVLTSNMNICNDPILKEIDFLNIESSESDIVNFINQPVKEYCNKSKMSISSWMDNLLLKESTSK